MAAFTQSRLNPNEPEASPNTMLKQSDHFFYPVTFESALTYTHKQKGDLPPNLSPHAHACYLADYATGNPTKLGLYLYVQKHIWYSMLKN